MMTNTDIPLQSWVRFTIFNGFASGASYLMAAFAPLPEKVALLLAFAFGPFFMLSSLGLYQIILHWKNSIRLQVAVLFNIVGTALVTLMLVVQQTSFTFHDRFKAQDRGTVTDEQLKWMFREVNAVQLGIDIAWDIFISVGTIFFCLAMWKHPVYGRVLPAIGALSGILLLTFNMMYFPEPPIDAGSIDFGPLVALWYLVLTAWTLVNRNKFQI